MNNASLIYRLPIVFVLLIFASCELINPDENIPSFLSIPAIELEADYSTNGSDSHKISEAWVYADDELLGSFELPARIPVLNAGSTEITVLPGIKKNGISDTRDIYPFYTGYSEDLNLEAGETFEVNPVVEYKDETLFPAIYDFDTSTGFVHIDTGNNLSYTTNDSEVFEGSGSMKTRTESSDPTFQIKTSSIYVISTNDLIDAYLEMDYRNEGAFNVYVTVYDSDAEVSLDLITVSPQEDWNKMYVELGEVLRDFGADGFEIGFRSTGLPTEQTTGIYLWDNVKIVLTSL